MRKYIVFLIFLILVGLYFVDRYTSDEIFDTEFHYRDDFNGLDRDFWYVGEWKTLFTAYDKVSIKNGILDLTVKDTDRGPFLLSKPIRVKEGDILTIKRRVKIHYANENFNGGFAILETNDKSLKPSIPEYGDWSEALGNGVALVEHVHNYDEESTRPGRDVFRVLPPTWEFDHNYAVLEPIFDDWFEEKIVYDTRSNKIKYFINADPDAEEDDENVFSVNGSNLNFEYIRVFMHSYGYYTGHSNKIDWIEVSITRSKYD